jgi:hypothetical protein
MASGARPASISDSAERDSMSTQLRNRGWKTNEQDQQPAQRVRCVAILDFSEPVVKGDARMIMDTDTLTEVHRDRLPKAHRTTDTVADLSEALAAEAEMATRLAAAERRALREEMQRRPHPEPLGGMRP